MTQRTSKPIPKSDLATVDLLPGGKWNAKAAFGDALQRCEIDAPAIGLWLNKDGKLRWSASSTNMETLWMLQKMIERIADGD